MIPPFSSLWAPHCVSSAMPSNTTNAHVLVQELATKISLMLRIPSLRLTSSFDNKFQSVGKVSRGPAQGKFRHERSKRDNRPRVCTRTRVSPFVIRMIPVKRSSSLSRKTCFGPNQGTLRERVLKLGKRERESWEFIQVLSSFVQHLRTLRCSCPRRGRKCCRSLPSYGTYYQTTER